MAALWEAPVERNAAEAAWLQDRRRDGCRDSVPRLLAEDPALGLFAMEYLPPQRYPVWKNQLRDGEIDADFAAEVGARLARIHRQSADRTDLAAQFANDATFEPIRIEPYLRATAARHPDLARAPASACRHHAGDQARAGAWRRQPEEHPVRARRARSSSTRNAPGTAIRPSISPSA